MAASMRSISVVTAPSNADMDCRRPGDRHDDDLGLRSMQPSDPNIDYGKVPKSLEELHPDPLIRHFDIKTLKAKEIMVFMEETKIWQGLLEDCIDRSGVNSAHACRELQEMVQERGRYYNSRFNPNLRPTKTPGIPPDFEPPPTAPEPEVT